MNKSYILEFFKYNHLPFHLAEVSRPFGELAEQLGKEFSYFIDSDADEELYQCLRKLLEAKDCAVRAALMRKM